MSDAAVVIKRLASFSGQFSKHQRKISADRSLRGSRFPFGLMRVEKIQHTDLLRRKHDSENRENKAAVPEGRSKPVRFRNSVPRERADHGCSDNCCLAQDECESLMFYARPYLEMKYIFQTYG